MDQNETWHGSRNRPRPHCVRWAPAPSKRGTTPIFGHCLLWPNRWMDKDVTWYGGRSRPCPRCVRWGPSSPQGAQTPNFRPMSVVAKWPDGSRCHLVRRQASARCHCVRWGSSSPQRGQHLHFSAHVYCGQTAVWIKMPHGTEIDLGPGHTVLDGDQAPPPSERGTAAPLFGRYLLWPNSRPSQLLLST